MDSKMHWKQNLHFLDCSLADSKIMLRIPFHAPTHEHPKAPTSKNKHNPDLFMTHAEVLLFPEHTFLYESKAVHRPQEKGRGTRLCDLHQLVMVVMAVEERLFAEDHPCAQVIPRTISFPANSIQI
jgi:hypothetical protein